MSSQSSLNNETNNTITDSNGVSSSSLGKRKVENLDYFASKYLRPSKYLLLSNDDQEDDKTNSDDDENNSSNDDVADGDNPKKSLLHPLMKKASEKEFAISSSSNEVVDSMMRKLTSDHQGKSLMEIGNDCFLEIIDFLELDEMKNVMFVSKSWARLIIPYFMDLTAWIYDNQEHLERLRITGMDIDPYLYGANKKCEGLFTELATWKASVCYDDEEIKEDYRPVYGHYDDDDDVLEHEEFKFHRQLIPFGSPLCKGTIKEQFEMVQDEIDLQSYKKLVEQQLGIPEKEQPTYEINPFVFHEQIKHEEKMIDPYIHEVQESIHVDSEHTEDSGDNFVFHSLRCAILRGFRRSASLFFEPGLIEDSFYQLKKFIYLMIKEAYETKFPNKKENLKFQISDNEYWSSYYGISYDELIDNPDDDLQLSSEDIENAFEKLTGNPLYFAGDYNSIMMKLNTNASDDELEQLENEETSDSSQEEEENQIVENDEEVKSDENSEDCLAHIYDMEAEALLYGIENEPEPYSKPDIVIPSEDEFSEEEEEEEEESTEIITDENFIDDSDYLEFDLENLGETLPEQLMKVSISVHEQVYGKERAHKEKLYLKNWYGKGSLFFSNCSKELENPGFELTEEDEMDESEQDETEQVIENEPLPIEEQFTPLPPLEESVKLTESQQIENDAKEDFEYFGYSLYDDDFDEFPIWDTEVSSLTDNNQQQATEEETLQYHLRRMLREQSYECILKYFNDEEEKWKELRK